MSNNLGTRGIGIFVLMVALAGCGEKPNDSHLPESLPNKNVPLDVMPGDPETLAVETDSSGEATTTGIAPSAAEEFELTEKGLLLGLAEQEDYLQYQMKWLGTEYPACNFFLTTALCEAGYCKKSKPLFIASEFDIYLMSVGFKEATLQDIKVLFMNGIKFDLVFQKDNPVKGAPGHVMVGVGYDPSKDRIIIAQASLGTVTNEVKSVSNNHILNWQGGFKIFVRR